MRFLKKRERFQRNVYFENSGNHNRKRILKDTGLISIIVSLIIFFLSCRKIVEIDEPASTIVTKKVFSTDYQATSAMTGVYYYMVNSSGTTLNLLAGGMTIYSGLSADELVLYSLINPYTVQFSQNQLMSTNPSLNFHLWKAPFSNLYHVNAVIEGLLNSQSVSDSVKTELLAEAKFVRAFINFYMLNLFGDIPYPTETDWRKNGLLFRMPVAQVYQNIIADLKEAQKSLPADFRAGNGERIIPNKLAATALLARVYLYTQDWENAEIEATAVINSGFVSLNPNLENVFTPNSEEAIWQLQQDNMRYNFNATLEGRTFIPFDYPFSPPFAYIDSSLLNAFEAGDRRRSAWVSSKEIAGTVYYFPYKYKTGPSQATPGGTYSEYYMALRLAEQYLIRAEARAMLNQLPDAIRDINLIRQRASLEALPESLNEEQVMAHIMQERRIEFFSEWGHRWLDLKRWGQANAVLAPKKGSNWQPTDELYPIPFYELQTDPNLTQNRGYN